MKLTSLAAFVTCALAASGLAQTPTWRAELIGTPPPTWSLAAPLAVNDAGQVVGNTFESTMKRAWIGSPTTGLQLLPLPAGATYGEVYDMNSSGVVAGRVLLSDGSSRGVIWRDSPTGYQVVLLPAGPTGLFPFDARGINDAGEVVGKYGILGGSYYWTEAQGVTQLTSVVYPTTPSDINNQRQIIGSTYRMDLDTMVLENLGNPTGTGFNYLFTELWKLNDIGEAGGYGNVATGQTASKQAVRFTDGPVWKAFNSQPTVSANVMALAASGDLTFQLGTFGNFVYVEGVGSISLQGTLDPAYSNWNVSGSYAPFISRGGRIACNGTNMTTGQSGIVLLTPLAFDDLGGASYGPLGEPVLSGYGALTAGSGTRIRLASAAPGGTGFFVASTSSTPIPLYGGTFFPNPAVLVVPLPIDALGRIDLSFVWPMIPMGTSLYLQVGVVPPASTDVFLSNALLGVSN